MSVASRFVQSRPPRPGSGDDGLGAGRDDDRVALEVSPSTSTRPRPRSGRRLEDLHAARLVARDPLGVVVVRDHVVAVGGEVLEVEHRRVDASRAHRLAAQLRRPEQRLRRDAAPVRALAADHLALDERDALPVLHERVQRHLAARAGAQDHHVEPRHGRDRMLGPRGDHRRQRSDSPDMPIYDRNPGVRLTRVQAIEDGEAANVSELELGVHTGTHVDAPLHFIENGDATETLPLEVLIGPAHVVDATELDGPIDADCALAARPPEGRRAADPEDAELGALGAKRVHARLHPADRGRRPAADRPRRPARRRSTTSRSETRRRTASSSAPASSRSRGSICARSSPVRVRARLPPPAPLVGLGRSPGPRRPDPRVATRPLRRRPGAPAWLTLPSRVAAVVTAVARGTRPRGRRSSSSRRDERAGTWLTAAGLVVGVLLYVAADAWLARTRRRISCGAPDAAMRAGRCRCSPPGRRRRAARRSRRNGHRRDPRVDRARTDRAEGEIGLALLAGVLIGNLVEAYGRAADPGRRTHARLRGRAPSRHRHRGRAGDARGRHDARGRVAGAGRIRASCRRRRSCSRSSRSPYPVCLRRGQPLGRGGEDRLRRRVRAVKPGPRL